MTPVNWIRLTVEYQEAVNLLVDHMVKTKKRNFLVFPTIFLFRHYIELSLKEIIINNWEYLDISKPFPSGHSIDYLWKICRECLDKVDADIDPGIISSEERKKQLDDLEADLKKFSEIDPDSEHFRYPVDKKGNAIEINEKLLIEVLRELPEMTQRISENLDGIGSGIQAILQDKYDALAQQERYLEME
jgi:hypothetical protein